MILILRKHKVGIQITAEKLEKKHGGLLLETWDNMAFLL